jgi:hypothetical protein
MSSPRRLWLAALVMVLAGVLGGGAVAAKGGHKAGSQEALAFASVLEDGMLQVSSSSDAIASVAIDNATPREGLAGCPDGTTLRIRTLDANGTAGSNVGPYNPLLVDHRFQIWIRGDRT